MTLIISIFTGYVLHTFKLRQSKEFSIFQHPIPFKGICYNVGEIELGNEATTFRNIYEKLIAAGKLKRIKRSPSFGDLLIVTFKVNFRSLSVDKNTLYDINIF
ncbi:MAG: hypothetical protein KAQ62_05005 [Cyclobacteriaceae bacterium]|nr:hypothetical protein [Cyclobacteriaceae bacterium]